MFFAFVCALYVNFIEFTPETDLLNVTTLVLEIAFGGMITWTVYILSKKWKIENEKISEKLEALTLEVKKIVSEESQIRKEIVKDLSYHLNSKLGIVIKELTHSLNMYENYKNDKDGKSEHWKSVVLTSYKRTQYFIDFHIDLLELMKIYGVSTARQYWNLLVDLQVTSSMYNELDEITIHEFASFVQDGLDKTKRLKEIIESLGTL